MVFTLGIRCFQTVWISGWGVTEAGTPSDTLRKASVQVVSLEECKRSYGSAAIQDNMLCAGHGGKDSCQGDSGGPAIWMNPDDGHGYSVGVTSWGVGCGMDGFPGVYVRVTSYLDWIISQMEGKQGLSNIERSGRSLTYHFGLQRPLG